MNIKSIKHWLAPICKKLCFRITGKIILSDFIRNFIYQWVWSSVRQRDTRGPVLDIGGRTSLFPAFLSWQGFKTTTIDPYQYLNDIHRSIQRKWYISYTTIQEDFLQWNPTEKFDIISALFTLQHMNDNDSMALQKIITLLQPNGLLFIVNEFNNNNSYWHRNRADGDMRVYSMDTYKKRIKSILELNAITIIEEKFAKIELNSISWSNIPDNAHIQVLLCKV